jgi:Zn-dependent peptidase ImmA (M78 family)
MKWISDPTGRFPHRPFFEDGEIDHECEDAVTKFLTNKYGAISYPINTNDLTILLDRNAGCVDLYADLTEFGNDVEGITEFYANKKPKVLISRQLSEQANRENRYRTTLAHEFGHVYLHGFLLSGGQMNIFAGNSQENNRCKRETMLNATKTDWMEWQAGYASGALIIPFTPLKELIRNFYQAKNLLTVAGVNSPEGMLLIQEVMNTFQVSKDAARVRLLKLNFLADQQKTPRF